MKLGIIQTRGLGDIIIAAPIAMYYIERGCEVYWPIDSEFIPSFEDAFPKINFIPIEKSKTGESTANYFYNTPLEELNKKSCNSVICLYSHLTGFNLGHERLQGSLPFDAYKFAVAKVPFKEKWNFKPRRNVQREAKIFEMLELNASESYNLIHDEGSNIKVDLKAHIKNTEIRDIKIQPLTENIFDWLGVIERAESIYLLDSVYANLVEQLNINTEKNLHLRSEAAFSPTFINAWNFI